MLLAGCHKDHGSGDGPDSPAERTVLVYMVAANTLGIDATLDGVSIGKADDNDIAEMLSIAPSCLDDRHRLLVFRDRYEGMPGLYEIRDGKISLVKEYDRTAGSLDVARMRTVIADAKKLSPADNFALVLWSHANGWLEDGTDASADASAAGSGRQRSFGIDRGRRMNVTDLAKALDGQQLEYLYFDCCLMGSVEVAYELRNATPYIVASTSELPRGGMPYQLTLPALMLGAPAGIVEAAATTFDYYAANPEPRFRTCTLSVIRTSALDRLAAATAAVYSGAQLRHPGPDVTNYNAVATYGYWIDFGEYVSALAALPGRDAALGAEFSSALAETVIYEQATDKVWNIYPVYHHSGLSTFVFNSPDAFTDKGYDHLAWARDVVSHHLD